MKPQDFQAEASDTTWWSAADVTLPSRPAIRVNAVTEGERPGTDQIAAIKRRLAEVDALVLAAAPLILRNYSFDHFKKLGVSEDRLVKEETSEAIAKAVNLEEAFTTNPGAFLNCHSQLHGTNTTHLTWNLKTESPFPAP